MNQKYNNLETTHYTTVYKHKFVCLFNCSGKMARLSSLSPSQSVSFRHGTNVEFSPNFNQSTNGPIDPNVPPMEGYNLQAVNHKSRDFSNPMYDAVQAGTAIDPTLGNGSGKILAFVFFN